MLEIDGRMLATDPQGYLSNDADWSPAVCEQMAASDGCVLTDNHWEVIRLLREYYQQYAITPPVRILVRAIRKRLGDDKGNSRYLYELFPYGPARQACRYAGLPKPTGCV